MIAQRNARTAHANQLHGQQICLCIYTDVLRVQACVKLEIWEIHPPASCQTSLGQHKGILLNISVECLTPGSSYICVYIAATYPEWNLPRIKSIGVLFWIYMGPSCHANGQKRPCCKLGPSYELSNLLCKKLGKSNTLLQERGWRWLLPFPFLPSSLQPYRALNQDVRFTLVSSLPILQAFFQLTSQMLWWRAAEPPASPATALGIPRARRLEEGCVWGGIVSRRYFGEAYVHLT